MRRQKSVMAKSHHRSDLVEVVLDVRLCVGANAWRCGHPVSMRFTSCDLGQFGVKQFALLLLLMTFRRRHYF